MKKIFISSVQKEFAEERKALADYLAGDSLLQRFFDTFVFERDIRASDQRPDELYLDKVRDCDIYLGLFGNEYGNENADGVSPTHLEYLEATKLDKTRLIFVKGQDDKDKHPKMQSLIQEVSSQLTRCRFQEMADLLLDVYTSLLNYLESKVNLAMTPWDIRVPQDATLDDLDSEYITRFVGLAHRGRKFPLSEDTDVIEVLTHLDLLDEGRPKNAALLLFGKKPQRFAISSEIKCAQFYGTEKAKPILSLYAYKGTAFQLVDQAIEFVMSRINISVGTRKNGPQAPVTPEIPRDVIAEAIVNAVAHRDYNSNGSVQVELYADRLEVWNPGTLPKTLTLQDLREAHTSIPGNPLLAKPLYLTKYIESMGTGTRDMIDNCISAGLPEPKFALNGGSFVVTIWKPMSDAAGINRVSDNDLPKLRSGSLGVRILELLQQGALSKAEIVDKLGQKRVSGQLNKVIRQMRMTESIELTIPGKPTSRLQKYQLTRRGRILLDKMGEK